jgi:hypothetical protein
VHIEKLTLRLEGHAGIGAGDVVQLARIMGNALADAEPLASGPALNARSLLIKTPSDTHLEAIGRAAAAALMSELRELE